MLCLKRLESWSLLLGPSAFCLILFLFGAPGSQSSRNSGNVKHLCSQSVPARRTFAMNNFTQGKRSLPPAQRRADRKAAQRNSLALSRWRRARTGNEDQALGRVFMTSSGNLIKRVCLGSGGKQGPCGGWRQQCGKRGRRKGQIKCFPHHD